MTSCDCGDVVLVRFPFTDLASTQQRPAVVISPTAFADRYRDCVLMPLTSQPQPVPGLALAQRKAAGRLGPTWVKPLVASLSLGLSIRMIGRLQPADDAMIRLALDDAIDARG